MNQAGCESPCFGTKIAYGPAYTRFVELGGVMDTLRAAIVSIGWLVTGIAFAGVTEIANHDDAEAGMADARQPAGGNDLSMLALFSGSDDVNAACAAEPRESASSSKTCRLADPSTVYRITLFGEASAMVGIKVIPSHFASATFIQHQAGIDTRGLISAERWLAENHGVAQTFAVGPWQDLTFEGSAFSSQGGSAGLGRREGLRIDSRSARLSFSPSPSWLVRLSRGTVSGLDRLVAGDEVRRTAVSATYRQSFADGDWEATIAWGRNSRKFREATVGYLVESAYRFAGVHTLFGRLEQVGSDDIPRENEALQRQLFKMSKLTFGYSQDLRVTNSLRLDAGAFITRHFVPSGMAPSYGSGPTAYMMFVRVKLR